MKAGKKIKTIPYQAHNNSANVLQLETQKVNSIRKEANMHNNEAAKNAAKGKKTLPVGCFFTGAFRNHKVEENMHKRKQRQLLTKQTCITAKGTKTLPAGCFFVGTFNNHQAEEN